MIEICCLFAKKLRIQTNTQCNEYYINMWSMCDTILLKQFELLPLLCEQQKVHNNYLVNYRRADFVVVYHTVNLCYHWIIALCASSSHVQVT